MDAETLETAQCKLDSPDLTINDTQVRSCICSSSVYS